MICASRAQVSRRSIAGAIDAAFGALACRRTQVASKANAEAESRGIEVVADMLPPGVMQHTFDITVQATDSSTGTVRKVSLITGRGGIESHLVGLALHRPGLVDGARVTQT